MGLDIDFIAIPKDDDFETSDFQKEIFSFRNHYDLESFMDQFFPVSSRGGAPLRITWTILEQMRRFASLSPDERKKECDGVSGKSDEVLWWDMSDECIPEIERMLNKGHKVYYRSW